MRCAACAIQPAPRQAKGLLGVMRQLLANAQLGLELRTQETLQSSAFDVQARGSDDGMFKGEALGLRAMYGEPRAICLTPL